MDQLALRDDDALWEHLDDELREKVVRWVEWANQAKPSE